MDRPTKLLYVLGRGRSGSTILAQVLGALDGYFTAGEVRMLWDPVLRHDSDCACGEPVRQCPVWSNVLRRIGPVDPHRVARWQREVVRESQTVRLLRGSAWPALAGYRRVMDQVYAAIAEVTGCHTIVDTSKRPSYAVVVRDLPSVDPFFLHLVRDPRASAYSWRTRRHTGAAGTTVAARGAVDATVRWNLLNLGAEAVLRTVRDRGLRLRYEDFTANPRDTVEQIAAWLDNPPVKAFVDDRTVEVPVGHTLAGNPSRERTGRVTVREDREWRAGQRPLDHWLATATGLVLLRRYGYPVVSRPQRPE